jgi:hypothetical protein
MYISILFIRFRDEDDSKFYEEERRILDNQNFLIKANICPILNRNLNNPVL